MKEEWIGLLDCNNFFVSCERLFRPDLQNKPVVVLSSNDGCVVARSQEVKDMGVLMGVPYFQVKDTLEKAQTKAFSSHFALYRDISRRVFTVMREELERVEVYSIDEAFFTLPAPDIETLQQVKSAVETRVGIPVSIGLAHTKTLAKFANTIAKKQSGIYVLQESDWKKRCKTVPLSSLWGVGGKLELAYKRAGLMTAEDLITAPEAVIKQSFGVVGVRLQAELSGQPAYHLSTKTEPQKSIVSSRTFRQETAELAILQDAVAYHVRHAVGDLRDMQHKALYIRVSLMTNRFGDFLLRGGGKEHVFTVPTDNLKEFLTTATKLVEELYEPGVVYKKAGVTLAQFTPAEMTQGALFDLDENQDAKAAWHEVLGVVDALNKKHKDQLLLGTRLREADWQAKKELRSPAYTTQWSQIAEVKA